MKYNINEMFLFEGEAGEANPGDATPGEANAGEATPGQGEQLSTDERVRRAVQSTTDALKADFDKKFSELREMLSGTQAPASNAQAESEAGNSGGTGRGEAQQQSAQAPSSTGYDFAAVATQLGFDPADKVVQEAFRQNVNSVGDFTFALLQKSVEIKKAQEETQSGPKAGVQTGGTRSLGDNHEGDALPEFDDSRDYYALALQRSRNK